MANREARLEEIREWRESAVESLPHPGDQPVGSQPLLAQGIAKIDWLLSEIDRLKAKLEGEES